MHLVYDILFNKTLLRLTVYVCDTKEYMVAEFFQDQALGESFATERNVKALHD